LAEARRRKKTTPLTPANPSMISSTLGSRCAVISATPTGEKTSAVGADPSTFARGLVAGTTVT